MLRKATIKIRIPDNLWMSEVSKRFPSADFHILSSLPLGLKDCMIFTKIKARNDEILQILECIENDPSEVDVRLNLESDRAFLMVKTRNTLPLNSHVEE